MNDVLGWQNTRWGMTADEIISAVGLDRLRQIPLETGKDWYAELAIPDVDIGRNAFDITFQMSSETDRLKQVLIRHEDATNRPQEMQFQETLEIIAEKFGQPARIGTSNEWMWEFPTTTIFLEAFYIEDIASFIAVRFTPSQQHTAIRQQSAF